MDERFAMMIPRSLAKAVIVVHTSESRGESWRVLESGGESWRVLESGGES